MATWTLGFNATGPRGTPGIAGSQITFGTANTYSSLTSASGNVGDAFFTTDTNYFYQKTSSGWPQSGTLLKGAMGVTGVNGASFYAGSDTPANTPPTNPTEGSLYLDLANGEIYKYSNGSWADQGFSIKGPAGQPGTPGSHIYHGSGAPSSTAGYNSGDVYIDQSTGDYYFFG